MKPSGRFTLNQTDIETWLKNAAVFSIPILIVVIPSIIGQIPADWKYAAVAIYALNLALDILRKFVAGK